jgi:hypothetical protein
MTPDYRAAAIHRGRANTAYDDAERFRQLGLEHSREAALRAARDEDRIAELLEQPTTTERTHVQTQQTYTTVERYDPVSGSWYEHGDYDTPEEARAAIGDQPGRWQVRTVTTLEFENPEEVN